MQLVSIENLSDYQTFRKNHPTAPAKFHIVERIKARNKNHDPEKRYVPFNTMRPLLLAKERLVCDCLDPVMVKVNSRGTGLIVNCRHPQNQGACDFIGTILFGKGLTFDYVYPHSIEEPPKKKQKIDHPDENRTSEPSTTPTDQATQTQTTPKSRGN